MVWGNLGHDLQVPLFPRIWKLQWRFFLRRFENLLNNLPIQDAPVGHILSSLRFSLLRTMRCDAMGFRAVMFDLDGTLLDTLEDLADSMNAVLVAAGFPVHELEAYKTFVGDGMVNLVRRAIPGCARNDDVIVARCLARMREEYGRRQKVKTRPYEGIPELLDELTTRRIRMAILSNKPDAATRSIVSTLLPRWRFDVVFGERAGMPRKPDPSTAREIAEVMGITCEEFLYVGDTDTDMITATRACMYPVGALWGFRKAEELLSSGARALIEKPQDLLSLLGEER